MDLFHKLSKWTWSSENSSNDSSMPWPVHVALNCTWRKLHSFFFFCCDKWIWKLEKQIHVLFRTRCFSGSWSPCPLNPSLRLEGCVPYHHTDVISPLLFILWNLCDPIKPNRSVEMLNKQLSGHLMCLLHCVICWYFQYIAREVSGTAWPPDLAAVLSEMYGSMISFIGTCLVNFKNNILSFHRNELEMQYVPSGKLARKLSQLYWKNFTFDRA